MCDCNLERPDIYEEITRKARKQHTCCECKSDIHPGDGYIVIAILYEGSWSKHKQCFNCNQLANYFSKETDCCYPLGYLYQELRDSCLLNFDKESQQWYPGEDWLHVVCQKPLRVELSTVNNS